MLTKLKKHRFIRLGDVLRLATTSLRANKIRSSLTILGITIGVFSVVGTMTALSAIRSSINSELAFMGTNSFKISRFPSMMINGDGWWNYIHRPEITFPETMRFKELMEQHGYTISMNDGYGSVRVQYEDRKTSPNIYIVGGNENTIRAYNYKMNLGRNLSPDDLTFNRSVIVLGANPAKDLFPDRNPVGEEIRILGHRYAVVGVMEERGEIFGQSQDNFVFMPLTRFMNDFSQNHEDLDVSVLSPNEEMFASSMDLGMGYMRMVRGLDPEDPNDFSLDTNDSMQESFNKIARIIGSAGLIISMIALLTAGVGIMNIMLVSVTERTREIGIRKSLGARSLDVLKQFLLESVFLSELGAFLGILLGIIIGNLIAGMMNVEPIFPLFWAIVAVIVCSIIGIGFGMYPAWKASQLDPVEALRFE
jgi:putative ABC transport system permease protein